MKKQDVFFVQKTKQAVFLGNSKVRCFSGFATDTKYNVYKQSFFNNDLYKEAKAPLDQMNHSSLCMTLMSG